MGFSVVAVELLDGANSAVLATVGADGTPQTSVVWVGRDGDDLVVSTQLGRQKDTNLRRNPHASLLVIDKADSNRYVEFRGSATVTEDVGRAVAIRLAELYSGPGAGEEYVQLPAEIIRTVIRITPERTIEHV